MSVSEDAPSRRNGDHKPDPTINVLAAVEAAITRQDDLRIQESKHLREVMALRSSFDQEIRGAETKRIDAIRAVDVGNVSRAAEVQAAQASTLAAQVATSAEAMRIQVAAAAAAAQTALGTALEPIQKDVADLRRVQYEQQGQRVAQTESKDSNQWMWATLVSVGTLVLFAMAVLSGHLK